MKPAFNCPPNPSAELLRREVAQTVSKLGESAVTELVERLTVTTVGIKVRHGFRGVPRVRFYNPEGLATVWCPQPADQDFVYLISDAETVVSVELF
jgi:hypothetical protein